MSPKVILVERSRRHIIPNYKISFVIFIKSSIIGKKLFNISIVYLIDFRKPVKPPMCTPSSLIEGLTLNDLIKVFKPSTTKTLSFSLGVFGFSGFLAISAATVVLMFRGMVRVLWSPGSIGDRFELLLQSIVVWSNHWFLGVGFRAQSILHSNPVTISHHWYPHNFVAEVLLLGGVVLLVLVVSFIVSVGLTASFDFTSLVLKGEMQVPLTFLWIQGLASALVSGHLALIPGLWVVGLAVVLNRFR